jgi:hypothetical protein
VRALKLTNTQARFSNFLCSMQYHLLAFTPLVIALLGCGSTVEMAPSAGHESSAPAKEKLTATEVVQADVLGLVNALYSDDIATVLKFTHPKIIKSMGGATNAESEIRKILSPMMAKGMKVESLTFPEAPTFFSSETEDFVFVPTLTTIAFNDGLRVESLNYQLGVKQHDASQWTYFEGSRINAESVDFWLPGFPSGQTFPKTYRKKL